MTKYETLAKELNKQIIDGQFKPNTKLPSIRELRERHGFSISTVLKSLEILEQDNIIYSRDRSGFYVSAKALEDNDARFSEPESFFTLENPTQIDNKDLVLDLIKSFYTPNLFNLGAAIPLQEYLPKKEIDKATKLALQRHSTERDKYQVMPGNTSLRGHISDLMRDINCDVSPENILITSGCQEAFFLALVSCCKKGDTVAVEMPTYPGFLQACENNELEVLEIPSSPSTGISIGALEFALQKWPIKALILSSNYSNPTCGRMPTKKKQTLLRLCEQHEIKIIEDDIYGDLSHDPFYRPRPIKSYDMNDTVIYCSSFSKTVSPGLRVGWVINKGLQKELEYRKYVSGLSAVTLSQDILAEYLNMGKHERYLQNTRRRYSECVNRMSDLIDGLIPEGTRITQPKGGFLLWVSLPNNLNTLDLLEKTAKRGVSFYPGTLFSATDKFSNCLRINCALNYEDKRLTESLEILFEETKQLL